MKTTMMMLRMKMQMNQGVAMHPLINLLQRLTGLAVSRCSGPTALEFCGRWSTVRIRSASSGKLSSGRLLMSCLSSMTTTSCRRRKPRLTRRSNSRKKCAPQSSVPSKAILQGGLCGWRMSLWRLTRSSLLKMLTASKRTSSSAPLSPTVSAQFCQPCSRRSPSKGVQRRRELLWSKKSSPGGGSCSNGSCRPKQIRRRCSRHSRAHVKTTAHSSRSHPTCWMRSTTVMRTCRRERSCGGPRKRQGNLSAQCLVAL
mmetsp:Transcript_56159/g.92904  ORF Transcript_56159/g.92904 Transcript_56159/m.92904 type:complete len:256 (+) Transcript_56159:1363-2130(+)